MVPRNAAAILYGTRLMENSSLYSGLTFNLDVVYRSMDDIGTRLICVMQNLRKHLALFERPMSPARIRRTECSAALDPAPQSNRRQIRHARPCATVNAKRIVTSVGLTWNEAPFKQDAPGTHPQNQSTQRLIPPPRKLEMIAIANRRCGAFL